MNAACQAAYGIKADWEDSSAQCSRSSHGFVRRRFRGKRHRQPGLTTFR
jgi:hypothetical protein